MFGKKGAQKQKLIPGIRLERLEAAYHNIKFQRELPQGELRRFYSYLNMSVPVSMPFKPQNFETQYLPPVQLNREVDLATRIAYGRIKPLTTINAVQGSLSRPDGRDMLHYKLNARESELKAPLYVGIDLTALNDVSYFSQSQKDLIQDFTETLRNYFMTYKTN